jgi:hypothetical protein
VPSSSAPSASRQWIPACAGVAAFIAPYAARAAAIPFRGSEWFSSYVSDWKVAIIGGLINLLLGYLLYRIVLSETFRPLAKGVAFFGAVSYLIVMHFQYFDLAQSSTAGLGVFAIPVYAYGIAIIGLWVGGLAGKGTRAT